MKSPALPLSSKAQHSSPSTKSATSSGGADSFFPRTMKSALAKVSRRTITFVRLEPNVNCASETARIAPREHDSLALLPVNDNRTDLCSAHQSRKIIRVAFSEIAIVPSPPFTALISEVVFTLNCNVCLQVRAFSRSKRTSGGSSPIDKHLLWIKLIEPQISFFASFVMSSSQVFNGEMPIPVDRIVRELSKSARPGFYGQCEIQLALEPKALEGVAFIILRQQKVRSTDQPDRVNAMQQETERELAVKKVVDTISRQLRLRLSTVKIVGHFADGMLNNCEIVDEERTQ